MTPETFLGKLEELKRKGWQAELHGSKIRLFGPRLADTFDPLTAVCYEERGVFYPEEQNLFAAREIGFCTDFYFGCSCSADHSITTVTDGQNLHTPGVNFGVLRRRILEVLELRGV